MESEGVVPLNNSIFNAKMANHTIDVYFFHMSAPSRATLLLVRALGIKHNVKIVDVSAGDQMKPEFIKMNPLHTIPVVNDGGFIVYDSHVIMKYLVDQYAKDDSLSPRDIKKATVVNQRLFFEATYLFPRCVEYFIPTMFAGAPPSEESRKKLEEVLQHMDDFLKGQNWFAGSNMTIADFSIIATFSTIDACEAFDLTKYQNLWQWFQRAKAAMSGFGYEEINQPGADAFGGLYKSKLK